jgi:hypothetical protein
MKKLVLTTVCALAVTGAAFAQGTLAWNVISPAAYTSQTNSQLYSPLFGGGSTGGGAKAATAGAATGLKYYYELLYNTSFTGVQISGASAPSNSFATLFGGTWADTGLEGTNSLTASFGVPIAGNIQASVSGWANGTTNNIVLVGWSSNLGSTWAVVSNLLATQTFGTTLAGANGFFGVSAAGYINPNLSPANGATLFNTTATANGLPINSLLTQLYLLPVPEPSTLALAGLGGLSLLLFRRRK